MPTSTLTSKGQVTVPKAIRDRLGLREGEILEFSVDDDGRIVVWPRGRQDGICGLLRDFAPQPAISVEEMAEAVRTRVTERRSRSGG